MAVKAGPRGGIHIPASIPSADKLGADDWVLELEKSILAHCIHLSEREKKLLGQSGLWVVENVESNQNNNVGLTAYQEITDRVMLGTDGMHGDMLRSAQAAFLAGQAIEDLGFDTVYDRFRNIHRYIQAFGGAGDTDNNLVVLDYDTPTALTAENFLGHFVYGLDARHVETVIAQGRVIVEDRRITTVDEAIVLAQAREMDKKLWDKMENSALKNGKVRVLYRRSRKEMPAAAEEIQALLDEGIELVELTAPECMLVEDGRICSNLCFRMKLGEKDADDRRSPIRIDGSEFELEVDSVISAIGQRVCLDFFPEERMRIDPRTHKTQLKNVFAGGDAVRGASTLIKAVGDGKEMAGAIAQRALGKAATDAPVTGKGLELSLLQQRRARREAGTPLPEIGFDQRSGFDMVIETLDAATAKKEAARCLQCDELCNVCVTVCPNRANMGFTLAPTTFTVQQARQVDGEVEIRDLKTVSIEQRHQVLNIGDYCNECGNCTTFCPTGGAPYRDKARVHVSAESFAASARGYYFTAANRLAGKRDGQNAYLEITPRGFLYEDDIIRATLNNDYRARKVTFKESTTTPVNLRPAVEMAILGQALCNVAMLTTGEDRYLLKNLR